MAYILKTDDGNVVVIDGGGIISAPFLERYLKELGGTVNTWILSHPHLDHIGAFLEILKNGEIQIDQIVHVPLTEDWVRQNEAVNFDLVSEYNKAVNASNTQIRPMKVGDTLLLGEGVQMNVLGGFNEDIKQNAINNSSLVFMVKSASKSILFLGDLGLQGGKFILKETEPTALKADYVQMAHHGQHGVDKAFYEAVNADYALWPTPKWLWENRADGRDYNTGNFMTFETRLWMEELGIKTNYVSGLDGTVQID